MLTVTLYGIKDSQETEQIKTDLEEIKLKIPHNLVEVDINSDKSLFRQFAESAPVLKVGPYTLTKSFTRQEILVSLSAAKDRSDHFEKVGDTNYQDKVKRGHSMTETDRFSLWLTRHYMLLVNLLVAIYVGLPFLAPVFMKVGLELPARVIYTVYSPLCHQLAFRSWFFFGEQAYYPRALAGINDIRTYEDIVGQSVIDVTAARKLKGGEVNGINMGYKVALCERDVAIYGSILIFGIMFALSGRKLRSIPWYAWVVIGLIPIGLDGGSQLPSLATINLPFWIPLRESTPLLRTITGCLFGISSAWYLFPVIEEGMLESRRMLLTKQAVVDAETKTEALS
jgi:uncharacterized membrane protein